MHVTRGGAGWVTENATHNNITSQTTMKYTKDETLKACQC